MVLVLWDWCALLMFIFLRFSSAAVILRVHWCGRNPFMVPLLEHSSTTVPDLCHFILNFFSTEWMEFFPVWSAHSYSATARIQISNPPITSPLSHGLSAENCCCSFRNAYVVRSSVYYGLRVKSLSRDTPVDPSMASKNVTLDHETNPQEDPIFFTLRWIVTNCPSVPHPTNKCLFLHIFQNQTWFWINVTIYPFKAKPKSQDWP